MKFLLKTKSTIDDNIIKELEKASAIIEHIFYAFHIILIETDNIASLKMDFIKCIEPDEEFELQAIQILPNIRVNKLKAANFLGADSVVAVIDSGMDKVQGIDIYRSEVFSGSADSFDTKIKGVPHGTVVGHIIKHLAPWGKIYNLKVSNDYGDIRRSSIIKALEYAYNNKIRIINISIGKINKCTKECILCGIVNQMADDGFAIIASVGNYGQLGNGITTCPGNAEKAFTVGAVDVTRQLADYSSVAPEGILKPDILAPGYVTVDYFDQPLTGTSFATPFISGVVTALSNHYSLEQIIDLMKRTAQSIGLPRNMQGHGLIHIENLLGALKHEKSIS